MFATVRGAGRRGKHRLEPFPPRVVGCDSVEQPQRLAGHRRRRLAIVQRVRELERAHVVVQGVVDPAERDQILGERAHRRQLRDRVAHPPGEFRGACVPFDRRFEAPGRDGVAGASRGHGEAQRQGLVVGEQAEGQPGLPLDGGRLVPTTQSPQRAGGKVVAARGERAGRVLPVREACLPARGLPQMEQGLLGPAPLQQQFRDAGAGCRNPAMVVEGAKNRAGLLETQKISVHLAEEEERPAQGGQDGRVAGQPQGILGVRTSRHALSSG